MTGVCLYCRQAVEDPIVISTGGGLTIWACFPCKTRRGVQALKDWDAKDEERQRAGLRWTP